MFHLPEMHISGLIIIGVTLFMFLMAIITLFVLFGRYLSLQSKLSNENIDEDGHGFLSNAKADFSSAYSQNGKETNTPAIIDGAISKTMKGALMGERFLNNSVSIMVTLGLLGTFLGLALSVTSLTELIRFSSGDEWMNVMDSVGGGLLSALSGMGVAFYTSLVGVACAIILTLFRTIFSPEAQRERLQTMVELWLDHEVAAQLAPPAPVTPAYSANDDAVTYRPMNMDLRAHAESIRAALGECTREMAGTLGETTAVMQDVLENSGMQMEQFAKTVERFNGNVRDFSEFNHHLRSNIERMDVNFIKLTEAMRSAANKLEGGDNR